MKFSKSECIVTDEKDEVLMRGIKTKSNFYTWVPQNESLVDKPTEMFPHNVETCRKFKGKN